MTVNSDFQALYDRADAAGKAAVEAAYIQPMVVQERASPLDDSSPVIKQWFVGDGPCGFAWVNVKPGTSRFAKWLISTGKARRDEYYGGVTIWISAYNQSMQKKEIYAAAFAAVLRGAGYDRAYSNSRMD